MGVIGRKMAGRIALGGAAFVAMVLLGILAQGTVQADDASSLSLAVDGCSSDECDLDPGETFTLNVNIDDAPDEGYVLVQSFIDYGSDLTYNMTDAASDEVLWPDVSPDVIVRDSIAEGTVLHGGLTGLLPPLPSSTFEGVAFALELECSDAFSSTQIALLPAGDAVAGTSGALFTLDGGIESVTPKVSGVTVNCGVAPEPEPQDPNGLPPTGSGPISPNEAGTSMVIWLAIGALLVVGVTGIGAAGLSAVRGRQN